MMIELAFCTIAFRDDPIEEVLPRVAEIGYDAAEVFWGQLDGKSNDELQAIRAISDEVGMPIRVISPYLCFTRGGEEYDASIKRVEAIVHAAGILGASKIRTFTDVGPTGIGSDVATDEQWAACIEGLKTIAAMDRDLTFVLETHEETLADTPDSVRRLLAAVAAPNLKLLVHPAGGDDFGGIEGYRRFADIIDHMHLSNHTPDGKMTWVEQGVFNYGTFIEQVRTAGYSGSISVEYCWRGATWDLAAAAYEHLIAALGR